MDEASLRVVVDTNVWISAFLNADGAPAAILDAFLARRFRLVASETLLDEIQEVAYRDRIRRRWRRRDDDVTGVIHHLRDRAISCSPPGTLQVCRDPKDDFLVETAIVGGARYIVSRDDDLKRDLDLMVYLRERGIEVLSVAQFLDLLAESSG